MITLDFNSISIKGKEMWTIFLGIYILMSTLAAILFWCALNIAKQSNERVLLDFSDIEAVGS